MPKFYVQCGPIQVVLSAQSVDQAALAALDSTLQTHLWIYDDPDLSNQDRQDHLMLEALCHLDPTIRISEQGFDRRDAFIVGTPETIAQWHRFMVGMQRLFVIAGLQPRPMADVAGSSRSNGDVAPRRPR